MKPKSIAVTFLLTIWIACGQGFIYDQQSADESGTLEGSGGLGQQPFGQSFTPSLSSIGFIRLYIFDGTAGNGGGVLSINLRTNSITGTVFFQQHP